MRSATIRKDGFTLVELVVVVFVVALVVFFILSAILKIREAGNCAHCINHQRQLALACHNANDTNGSMPPFDCRVMPAKSVYSNFGSNYGSLFYALVPFIESSPLYNSGVYSAPNAGPNNKAYAVTVLKGSYQAPINYTPGSPPQLLDYLEAPLPDMVLTTLVRCFVCPSDPSSQEAKGLAPNGWAGASYGGNFLVFGNSAKEEVNDPDGLGGSHWKGAWGQKASIPQAFPDGTANTILFAEKYLWCNTGHTGTAWAWPNHDSSFAPAVAMESPWNDGTRFQLLPTIGDCVSQYAQTGHSGGMIVTMADGSARTLSPSISALTYQHAMQPNDGEELGPDW
jgi:prepilin-type N-terminal cleavage/methylation domain-containing protein